MDERDLGPTTDVWAARGVEQVRRSRLERVASYGGVRAWIQVASGIAFLVFFVVVLARVIW